jgi:D-methionine transport system permease protein
MSPQLWTTFVNLANASLETLTMTFVAGLFAVLLGGPLGIVLFITQENGLTAKPALYRVLAILINATRSLPFIILLLALIPFTRLLVGTSIGTAAAIVPLTIGAIPFVARLVETALQEIPVGLLETGQAMGASTWQIIREILLPESLPGLIQGITLTLVTLLGFSAMAGTVGGGGLGDLAIRYGVQRFDSTVMVLTVIVLIVMVQLIQFSGDRLVKWARPGN